MMAQPGDIVLLGDEHRVVVDVAETDDHANYAVLRFTDDDPRREVDADGGEIHLTAELADSLLVVGHI